MAYYRVSTQKQQRSGLGLDAQRESVMSFVGSTGGRLAGEWTEAETGKGSNALDKRPQLKNALEQCRKLKATLLIAKLDRLARNVHFVSGLLESKVNFIAVDMPEADRAMIRIVQRDGGDGSPADQCSHPGRPLLRHEPEASFWGGRAPPTCHLASRRSA